MGTTPMPGPETLRDTSVSGPGIDSRTDTSADVVEGVSVGRYRLHDELGRGGMGVVYLASDPELDRKVAIKVVRAGHEASEDQNRRFLREARAVARLKHPNIVEVYDIGTYAGGVYYAMEYVEGRSLAQCIAGTAMPPREVAQLALGIARALECAHGAGLIHRDVKPANILLDGDTPKLTDFGLVKQLDAETTVALTQGGQVLGTPAYMAPEQWSGDNDAVVPATDQYSLGLIMFEMLAGHRPARSFAKSKALRRMTEVEPPRLDRREVPRDLDLIRRRTMAFDPSERYPSCAELAADLERFLAGLPVLAMRPGLRRRLRWAWQRNRLRLAISAAVILAVLGGMELRSAWSRWQQARAEAQREAEAEARGLALDERMDELVADGEWDEAEQLFQRFSSFEDNRGTRALAVAFLHHGQRLRAGGREEAALAALAAAFAGSEDEGVQGSALVEMGEAFRDRYRWSSLLVLLQTMQARTPAALDDARMHRLHLDAALARRQLGEAATLAERSRDEGDHAPLLSHLARATKTGHHSQFGVLWDVDDDGTPELVMCEPSLDTVRIADLTPGSMVTRQRLPMPAGFRDCRRMLPLVGSSSPALLIPSWPSWSLLVADDGLARVAPLSEHSAPIEASTMADLDGDGRLEHHISVGMELFEVLPGVDGDWSFVAPERVNAVPSRIGALAAGDLDRDGRPELVVGAGGWIRYDLRLMHAAGSTSASGTTRLETIARRQLRDPRRAAILDAGDEALLAVMQPHDPTQPLNYHLFPADSPQSDAQGIHLLAFTDGHLESRGLIPLPRDDEDQPSSCGLEWSSYMQFVAEDLDDDGIDELLVGGDPCGLFIYRRDSNGQFRELALPTVTLLGLARVDDSVPELIVSLPDLDDQVWILGVGEDRLPPVSVSDAPAAAGDNDLRGPVVRLELATRWQRAEDLLAIGLRDAAVGQLREVASLALGSVDEGRALLRAGQILAAEGRHAEAGAVLVQAAANEATAARAWELALDEFLLDLRWPEAQNAAERRLTLANPPPRVRRSVDLLQARARAQTTLIDFRTTTLASNLWLGAPISTRVDPQGQGLRLATAGDDPMLALPVRPTGEPLRVVIEFELEHIDWASYLRWRLDGERGPMELFVLNYRGGGGVHEMELRCFGSERQVISQPDALLRRPLRLVWQQGEDGRASCELYAGEETVVREVHALAKSLTLEPTMELRVFHSQLEGEHATIEQLLRSIELTGLAMLDQPATALQRAHGELALGRPDAALAILEAMVADQPAQASDPRWQLARAVVAAGVGDQATTQAMLAAALAHDSDLHGNIHALIRHHLDRFEVPLRAILGDRYYHLFARSVLSTVMAHRDENRMAALLRLHLDGLEQRPAYLEIAGLSPDRRHAAALERIELQIWRGRAWRVVDELSRAIRTLEAARGLLGDLGPASEVLPRGHQQRIELLRLAAGRELALCYLARSEPERAIETLLAAASETSDVDVTIDILGAARELRPLHDHPRWRELEALRRLP